MSESVFSERTGHKITWTLYSALCSVYSAVHCIVQCVHIAWLYVYLTGTMSDIFNLALLCAVLFGTV